MTMFKLILLLFYLAYVACYDDSPIVKLPQGEIQGYKAQSSRKNLTYYAYLGIPYAAPPTGKLRFQAPQAHDNWNGVLKTTALEHICYQSGKNNSRESEDCLYLDVYTPVIPGSSSALPVLVNIHGGTFINGAAFNTVDGAQYVLENNVLVVSINYRLNLFGFLSTLDTVIPGNYGIKDQQFALKWVQQNIHLFGGDPTKVTVMGQSAGSASVTYQLLGRNADGLFRAAIAQSGSALNTWAYQRNAVDLAYKIAALVDPSFDRNKSSQELLDLLLAADAKQLHQATFTYKSYAPVVEVEHDGAMITENMYQAVLNGHIAKVPVMIGICSEEALNVAASVKELTKTYDSNIKSVVDDDMGITDEETKQTVGEKIKSIYLPNGGLFQDNVGKAIQYFGDNRYMKAPIKFAEMAAQHIDLYFYQFSYHGKMGGNGVANLYDGIGKVMHAEDLQYFWTNSHHSLDGLNETDVRTMDRYIGLLTNFAIHLNPTPTKSELFQNVTWPKVTNDHYYYLDLDTDITIKEHPREFSYSTWVDIFEQYAAKPLISF